MKRVQMCAVPEGSGLKPIYGNRTPTIIDLLLYGREEIVRRDLERFGDLSYANVFGRRMVNVMTPTGAETVITNRNRTFVNEPAWNYYIGVAFKRGILLMDFEEHHHHRRIMQQAFTNTNLKGYLQEMQPFIAERIGQFPVGSIRMADAFKAITLDLALEVFVGVKLPPAESHAINKAFGQCLDGMSAVVRHPVPGGKWARALEGRKVLEGFFYQELPGKRAKESPDLFSVLCHSVAEDGHVFTDEEVVNHMIFVLFAAHDTSTTAITTMAYYMGRYPQWQRQARARALSMNAEVGYDTLTQMPELDLVMKESLRLHPPVPVMLREASEDTEIDGHFVPRGTIVSVSPPAIHRNPHVWADPDKFDPERFTPERHEDKVHRMAWIPFGSGVHKCIGLYFAQMEIKTILHNLLRNYEWSVSPDYEWCTDLTTLGLPKGGLPARVHSL